MKHPLTLLLAYYLSVCCLSHNLMAFWTAKHTSLMLNKKKKVRGFLFVFDADVITCVVTSCHGYGRNVSWTE